MCLVFFNKLFISKNFLIIRDYKIVQSSHISTPHPVSPEVNILHNLDTFVKTNKLTLIRCFYVIYRLYSDFLSLFMMSFLYFCIA